MILAVACRESVPAAGRVNHATGGVATVTPAAFHAPTTVDTRNLMAGGLRETDRPLGSPSLRLSNVE